MSRATMFTCDDCGHQAPSDRMVGSEYAPDTFVCADPHACQHRQQGNRDRPRFPGDPTGVKCTGRWACDGRRHCACWWDSGTDERSARPCCQCGER